MEKKKPVWKKVVGIILKTLAIAAVIWIDVYLSIFIVLFGSLSGIWIPVIIAGCLLLPGLVIPLVLVRKKKRVVLIWLCCLIACGLALGLNVGIDAYQRSLIIDTSPNIPIGEYLPFDPNSKIVTLDHPASLQLTDPLPVIDGAAALFPVYSAYVNAVYPENTVLWDDHFLYSNTVEGYRALAQKERDIFIGVYPSQQQQDYAREMDTEFTYHQIGQEAFVFFVHKNNPVDSLTAQQIRDIYSGKITNWREVGGKDEPIVAYQRNEGSGSQSMLVRFMDGQSLMEPPKEQVNDLMSGIITQVADYRSKSGSIGFSFRFYVEGIIQNPDIKMIAVDGIAPTADHVRNGLYPIVTPIYAVSYRDNSNPNVKLLLDWILSEEGQELLEKTGYVGN